MSDNKTTKKSFHFVSNESFLNSLNCSRSKLYNDLIFPWKRRDHKETEHSLKKLDIIAAPGSDKNSTPPRPKPDYLWLSINFKTSCWRNQQTITSLCTFKFACPHARGPTLIFDHKLCLLVSERHRELTTFGARGHRFRLQGKSF